MKCVVILVGIKILAYLGEGEFVLILTNWSFTWKTSTQARPGKQVSCLLFREVTPPQAQQMPSSMNRLKKSSAVALAFKLLVGPVLESSKSGIGFGRGPYDLSQVNTGVSPGSPNPRNASSSLPLSVVAVKFRKAHVAVTESSFWRTNSRIADNINT